MWIARMIRTHVIIGCRTAFDLAIGDDAAARSERMCRRRHAYFRDINQGVKIGIVLRKCG